MPYKRNERTTAATQCKACLDVLPADDFYSCPPKANGLDSVCKPCKRAKANARHEGKRRKDPLRDMRTRTDWGGEPLRYCDMCGFKMPKRLLLNLSSRNRLGDWGIGWTDAKFRCAGCYFADKWIMGETPDLTLDTAKHLARVFAAGGSMQKRLMLLAQTEARMDGVQPAYEWNALDGRAEFDAEFHQAFFWDAAERRDSYDARAHKAKNEINNAHYERLSIAQRLGDPDEIKSAEGNMRWELVKQGTYRKREAKMRRAARSAMNDMAMRLDAIAAELDGGG